MASFRVTNANIAQWKADGITVYQNNSPLTYVSGSYYEFPVGYTIKFTTNIDSFFTSVSLYNPFSGDSYYFTLSDGGKTATRSAPESSSLDLEYAGTFIIPGFNINTGLIEEWAENNFTMYVNDVLVVGNKTAYVGDVIKLVGINNYGFTEASFWDTFTQETLDFVVSADKLTATCTLAQSVTRLNYTLEAVAVVDVRGSNSAYVIEDVDLAAITSKRFINLYGDGNSVDFGKLILGLIKLPFAVDAATVVGTEQVMLGPIPTGVFGGLMNIDRLRHSLGSITVPDVDGNALDFIDTEAILHLPYTNPVKLDIDYVIGQTVGVGLLINLYDGTADYNITSSKLGGVVITQKVALDVKIPFANPETAPAGNSPTSIDFGVDNGVKTAYIEVLRKGQVLPYGFFTSPVVVESTIGFQTGYVVVEDVNLKVPRATASEIAEINRLLGDGVILT